MPSPEVSVTQSVTLSVTQFWEALGARKTRGTAMACDAPARAKTLVADWEARSTQAEWDAVVSSHFAKVPARKLIRMWETGKNLDGRTLNDFEFAALCEAWTATFGELPPDDAGDDTAETPPPGAPDAQPVHPDPADDTMLSTADVVGMLGVSESTLRRMRIAGYFPQPIKIKERRSGWPAREVKAWLAELDEQRRKPRV